MDSIQLTGVRALGSHGVLASEHTEPQPFVVDVQMIVDTRLAAATDSIADTVDYGQIAQRIVHIIEGEHVDLIEKLANKIAHAILQSYRVQAVTVTVHKPQAPITVPFSDVSVTVTRVQDELSEFGEGDALNAASQAATSQHKATQHKATQSPATQTQQPQVHHAVIALGGNMGQVAQTLRSAIVSIDSVPGNQVSGISPLYRTKAWGMPEGTPDFYNAVIELDTTLDAHTLLHTLQTIEATFGRRRDVHWGNRTLDLDIIDFDHEISEDPNLTLPHPRAWQRAFVLTPWLELDPDATIAGPHGGSVAQLVQETPDADAVQLASRSWILGESTQV